MLQEKTEEDRQDDAIRVTDSMAMATIQSQLKGPTDSGFVFSINTGIGSAVASNVIDSNINSSINSESGQSHTFSGIS